MSSRRRSRKRSVSAAPAGEPGEPPRRLRGEERDALARADLTPLEPGERPPALRIAAGVAAALAVLNVVLWAAGVEVQGQEANLVGILFTAGILALAAWGMWSGKYWAVLGFQTLLALSIVLLALQLIVASNVWAALIVAVIIGLGGWLFWKLVRVLGRMKVPSPSA